jgi:hypothetical protein
MFDDMTPQQLREKLAKFQNPDSGVRNQQEDTRSPDELRTAFILAKKTPLTEDDKTHLRNGIISWEQHRND